MYTSLLSVVLFTILAAIGPPAQASPNFAMLMDLTDPKKRAFASSGGAKPNAACANKNVALSNPINRFCQGPIDDEDGFEFPSGWTELGVWALSSDDGKEWGARIYSTTYCSQHHHTTSDGVNLEVGNQTSISSEECMENLLGMCVKGDSEGGNQATFEGCGLWETLSS